MSITVRSATPSDAAAWAELYRGYRSFYRLPDDDTAVATTWGWVVEGSHGLQGLVAADEAGRVVGLANLRWFARPSTAATGLYLDDLFTEPSSRGTGVATALLAAARGIAAERGANVVRWVTASDNAVARRLYDEHATATAWVTYDMAPTPA